MMLETLRAEVLEANLELVRRGLVVDTFGNASGISREKGLVVIKPSGVDYATLQAEDLVISDLKGSIVEGSLRPSSDLPTHIALYVAFEAIGVGSGLPGDSVPGNHPRGLFPRSDSGHVCLDAGRDQDRLRMEHRASDHPAV
jgi:hypothetical protein